MPHTAIHWQREELSVGYPPSLEEADARAIVVACLGSSNCSARW